MAVMLMIVPFDIHHRLFGSGSPSSPEKPLDIVVGHLLWQSKVKE